MEDKTGELTEVVLQMVVVLAAGREGSIAWAAGAWLESRGFCLLLLGTFFLVGFPSPTQTSFFIHKSHLLGVRFYLP